MLHGFDAGYLSYSMIKKVDEIGAYVLFHGKANIKGIVRSISINGKNKTLS